MSNESNKPPAHPRDPHPDSDTEDLEAEQNNSRLWANTWGGAIVRGAVRILRGDFVGRDKVTYNVYNITKTYVGNNSTIILPFVVLGIVAIVAMSIERPEIPGSSPSIDSDTPAPEAVSPRPTRCYIGSTQPLAVATSSAYQLTNAAVAINSQPITSNSYLLSGAVRSVTISEPVTSDAYRLIPGFWCSN
ncbi:MAG: hypothetical protein R3A44_32400 [Caldilineaceae bacterium]